MIGNGNGDWRELCKAASNEQDPEKLLDLIRQINQALGRREASREAPRRTMHEPPLGSSPQGTGPRARWGCCPELSLATLPNWRLVEPVTAIAQPAAIGLECILFGS